ncbi:hypothetical protein Y032_0839g2620 [Ancylostoma ceylanicum]|uniref:Uncharacterized protein n=1 Tax=Ancylostoma ceylanicum TaxID=53326 RepID=A0A016WD89_9BILA|nr:hypothetical protein Y032_0839g2620 [Ancylostoma ceylanicum]
MVLLLQQIGTKLVTKDRACSKVTSVTLAPYLQGDDRTSRADDCGDQRWAVSTFNLSGASFDLSGVIRPISVPHSTYPVPFDLSGAHSTYPVPHSTYPVPRVRPTSSELPISTEFFCLFLPIAFFILSVPGCCICALAMVRTSKRNNSDEPVSQDLPLWATKLIDKYEQCANRIQEALSSSFEKVFAKISEIDTRQKSILERLAIVEAHISRISNTSAIDQNALYSAVVKVRADEGKIEEKLRRITWVEVGEQKDEVSTKKFDYQALKEVVKTSGDSELVREFSEGRITAHRFPRDQPRGANARGRIIKIELPSQTLKDRLLHHMKQGRQSLTKEFIHS